MSATYTADRSTSPRSLTASGRPEMTRPPAEVSTDTGPRGAGREWRRCVERLRAAPEVRFRLVRELRLLWEVPELWFLPEPLDFWELREDPGAVVIGRRARTATPRTPTTTPPCGFVLGHGLDVTHLR